MWQLGYNQIHLKKGPRKTWTFFVCKGLDMEKLDMCLKTAGDGVNEEDERRRQKKITYDREEDSHTHRWLNLFKTLTFSIVVL